MTMMACHAGRHSIVSDAQSDDGMPRPTSFDRVCCPKAMLACHARHRLTVCAVQGVTTRQIPRQFATCLGSQQQAQGGRQPTPVSRPRCRRPSRQQLEGQPLQPFRQFQLLQQLQPLQLLLKVKGQQFQTLVRLAQGLLERGGRLVKARGPF